MDSACPLLITVITVLLLCGSPLLPFVLIHHIKLLATNKTLLCWTLKAGLLVWPKIFAHLKAMISLCAQGPEAISHGHMPWLQGPKSVISFCASSSSVASYLIAGRIAVVTTHFSSQGSTSFLTMNFFSLCPGKNLLCHPCGFWEGTSISLGMDSSLSVVAPEVPFENVFLVRLLLEKRQKDPRFQPGL